MQEELNKLHETLVKPVMSSGICKRASKFLDATIAVGMAAVAKAPLSTMAVKLTDMRQEYVKLLTENPDYSYVRLDKEAIELAFNVAITAARPVIAGKVKLKPRTKSKSKEA